MDATTRTKDDIMIMTEEILKRGKPEEVKRLHDHVWKIFRKIQAEEKLIHRSTKQ